MSRGKRFESDRPLSEFTLDKPDTRIENGPAAHYPGCSEPAPNSIVIRSSSTSLASGHLWPAAEALTGFACSPPLTMKSTPAAHVAGSLQARRARLCPRGAPCPLPLRPWARDPEERAAATLCLARRNGRVRRRSARAGGQRSPPQRPQAPRPRWSPPLARRGPEPEYAASAKPSP